MQRICIDNHNRIFYYSNPAGYIAEKEAVVDTMFQTQELESFLQKQALTIRWEDGVYDRLLLGQRSGHFDPEAPPMKNCRVWMYRGAWAEWEMDHIEMAVPISPEELRFKRNAILKHQSQAESAPYLGDDERLFWQRAEDRNRATAELYRQLGLASYEAIEAFVQYIPLR